MLLPLVPVLLALHDEFLLMLHQLQAQVDRMATVGAA